ncbi:Na/Pi cotransporter family protein [Thermoflavimicrobium dichotomicum]|uniref:Phosphate:Na+ symporter n=1 Tax=Thermoflavimicrobium dichotomicum TaxID=46223 RepID=A0A1I3NKC0_9BACL|nr:Na/Pi symporter [Thermoflavimicrobium dichotomicum]SFJ09176.1 phosphate:Na+ symporter [Thermoflavimicrobium dichotomicum]
MTEILFPFTIGLIVFLYGLNKMRTGFETLAGENLKGILLRFTKTPFRGFITGTITTALLQSSTAVTVLTIGFVHAGLISFTHSIGIILGTNIGTTVTTQILALNIEDFAVPFIVIGIILRLMTWKNVRPLGFIISGFGFLFLGIEIIQWLIQPLKERGWIDLLIENSGNPIISGILVGAIITALIHSSSATIAITMGFYASNLVTLPFAIAVIYGSNVGTCVTGMIAAIQTNIHAKRVAIAHLILNIAGVVLFAPLIPVYIDWIPYLSDSPTTQIAHVQTLFNVICSLFVLPIGPLFAKFIIWLVPERKTVWKWSEYPRKTY